ncbi:MAG: efflux RND transporter periplasmic adaptor subunit [Clostridia bacterium]|nr:efflux RND transporter periplasmic adaptor subunit [Clostridia bacterium]
MKKIRILLALLFAILSFAGCGGKTGAAVSVQSVAMICGIGPTTRADRFAGVIEARGETKIRRDANKTVAELKVSAGDVVQKDQVLFVYDKEQFELDLEKAGLELEQLKSTLAADQSQIAQLEKDRSAVDASEKLSYTLEIQELTADMTETKYNISIKEKEIEKLKSSEASLEVKSPVDGTVQSVNENGSDEDYGYGESEQAYIVITQTDAYRVKGYVNEMNRAVISEGLPVLIRSRTDDTTLRGTITKVDLDNPQRSGGDSGFYSDSGDDETVTSSKYPFYADIEKSEPFILGQHVFIEPDYGQYDGTDELSLPAYYIVDAENAPFVWAQNDAGKLEKRALTLGAYNGETDSYPVNEGLSAEDFIAFPDETLHEGMDCSPYDDSGDAEPAVKDGSPENAAEKNAVIDGALAPDAED